MIIRISTKCNVNGNRYQLLVDTDKKTFSKGSYLFIHGDITTTKKEINDFIKYVLLNEGYKENK